MTKKQLKKFLFLQKNNSQILIKKDGLYSKIESIEYQIDSNGQVFIVLVAPSEK